MPSSANIQRSHEGGQNKLPNFQLLRNSASNLDTSVVRTVRVNLLFTFTHTPEAKLGTLS